VLIGKDTRLSGYMIETALVAGFHLGRHGRAAHRPIPDAAVGMLTRSMPPIRCDDLGLAHPSTTTASSCSVPTASALRRGRHEIEALLDAELTKKLAKGADLGRARRIDGVQDRYIEFAKRTLPRNLSLGGLRIVIDCAHGAGYRVAPEALKELDAEVISIGIEPDGFNINRECGSTEPPSFARR